MKDYPRYITPGFEPFDPLQLAAVTESVVSRGTSRKYTKFSKVGAYGGISTGFTVGCCLRCIYCWVNWSRDFPEAHGRFYTPQQVFQILVQKARTKRVNQLRISGGEPTLCRRHLLEVLEQVKDTKYLFMLETNGILLGHHAEYAKQLERFSGNLHVRVSLKAGFADGFQKRTGAKREFFQLPFSAVKNLMQTKLDFHVACMSDPEIMPRNERQMVISKLKDLRYRGYLEEERSVPYPMALIRLEKAGYGLGR
jgi:uncharacterized Fe-S cluster-containing radical SAM superfamily protein